MSMLEVVISGGNLHGGLHALQLPHAITRLYLSETKTLRCTFQVCMVYFSPVHIAIGGYAGC
jgi:hypothetical protein